MKLITNWRNATVSDIETDGLLDEATLLHVLSYQLGGDVVGTLHGEEGDRIVKFFNYHMDNSIPIVFHNGIMFDIRAVEKLFDIDLGRLMVIDTLALSWYLNTARKKHALASFEEDYGFAKVAVSEGEWKIPEGATKAERAEHRKLMISRCETDVTINKCLWEDLKVRLIDIYSRVKSCVDRGLVDGTRMSDDEVCYLDRYKGCSTVDEYIDRILTFLMFKMDTARIRDDTMWEADVEKLLSLIDELDSKLVTAKEALEEVMPKVPKYVVKNPPKKPLKKDLTPSATGIRWNNHLATVGKVDDLGNPICQKLEDGSLKVLGKYEAPNAGSGQQVKDWLYGHGWVPETFEFNKKAADYVEAMQAWVDGGFKKGQKPKPKSIPQLSIKGDNGKELCPSVKKLIEKVPEVAHYDKFTTIVNRLGVVIGWRDNLVDDKYLRAGVGGFTSTLRDKHTGLVNIPNTHAPYGEAMRSVLIAGEGNISLGTDLSGLEDRIKHHAMLPFDPEYVKTMMADNYDAHILLTLAAGLIDQEQFERYMAGDSDDFIDLQRRSGKTGNYACQYGGGAGAVASGSGLSLTVAKRVVDGYWELNWAIKAIAEDQCVIVDDLGNKWLINPVNGFAYELRKEADRFSAYCQGTGSFMFDMWVDTIYNKMLETFGVKRGAFHSHDEVVINFVDTESNREVMQHIVESSIQEVNETYMLRRPLGCDTQFGDNYAQIH